MNKNQPLCRSCGSSGLNVFLDLGKTPLADRFLTSEQLNQPEPKFPLEVAFCDTCGLVQILETVPPDMLFRDSYPYYSSFSPALLEHSRENARELITSRGLGSESFVVELASNDGYLLKNYVEHGIPCLGIDPAEGPATAAIEANVPTLCTYFTKDLAFELSQKGQRADVIHANNVLAHVADTNGFVGAIEILLKDNGVAVIEVPYVRDLIDHCEFDTIYHEHLCYFSVTALDRLFKRHSLYLNDVRRIPIHGGSLRLSIEHAPSVKESVRTLLAEEEKLGLTSFEYYKNFAGKVSDIRQALRTLLFRLKGENKKIVAYGAAAKGSTLINYTDIGRELIDFVVDRNTYKHNHYMPGKYIPIYAPERIGNDMPDYVLLLAWNFADEIMQQQEEYRRRGGEFIIPVPYPRIV